SRVGDARRRPAVLVRGAWREGSGNGGGRGPGGGCRLESGCGRLRGRGCFAGIDRRRVWPDRGGGQRGRHVLRQGDGRRRRLISGGRARRRGDRLLLEEREPCRRLWNI